MLFRSVGATDLTGFSNIAYLGNMDLWLGNTDNSARGARFYAPSTSTAYASRLYSRFAAGAQTATINYTLPTSQPSVGQVLAASAVTGTGPYAVTLSWATASGGNDSSVIYGPSSTQARLTPRTTPLYNIAYLSTAPDANRSEEHTSELQSH